MNEKGLKDKFFLLRELQEELFYTAGEGWFRVVSGSMCPLINVNDRVLVKTLEIRELRAGDIVLFKVDDKCIAHRIIKVLKKDGKLLFYQKGDANKYASLLSPESVMGKVIAVEKKGHVLALTSGRIRIINHLLAMKNCNFFGFPVTHNDYEEIIKTDQHIHKLRCLYPLVKKPLRLCNRIIAKMIS